VIVSQERATRPFDQIKDESPPGNDTPQNCPFCRGNESQTPDSVLTVTHDLSCRHDGSGANDWLVRVIPNRFPAVTRHSVPSPELPTTSLDSATSSSHTEPGYGVHEVVIESPSHVVAMHQLSITQFNATLIAYRERLSAHWQDDSIACVTIFKNSGSAAGASLNHIHSQIIATPMVTPALNQRVKAATTFFERNGQTAIESILTAEVQCTLRIVIESEFFVALCPFASRYPAEMLIAPRVPSADFTLVTDRALADLALVLRNVLQRLNAAFPDAAFNYILHTTPATSDGGKAFHWHIELLPRLTGLAGFELGSGMHINILAPEDAADRLRSAI